MEVWIPFTAIAARPQPAATIANTSLITCSVKSRSAKAVNDQLGLLIQKIIQFLIFIGGPKKIRGNGLLMSLIKRILFLPAKYIGTMMAPGEVAVYLPAEKYFIKRMVNGYLLKILRLMKSQKINTTV
jgi:hypothetical protein